MRTLDGCSALWAPPRKSSGAIASLSKLFANGGLVRYAIRMNYGSLENGKK